ncbi:hypothetical protein GCM10009827_061230 [Dactylosporangium maewongense]|uniref:Uncharacterized protein n=1 Tax=Dactylosporangium maewongense TaxID=634393 RepID=A0ABP4M1P7_9ACTN
MNGVSSCTEIAPIVITSATFQRPMACLLLNPSLSAEPNVWPAGTPRQGTTAPPRVPFDRPVPPGPTALSAAGNRA